LASAQSTADVYLGLGTAHSKATGFGFENLLSNNALATCIPSSSDPTCEATSSLGGVFLNFGGDVMLTKRYGLGFTLSVQPTRQDYGPLQSRETFYDVNGIYVPLSQKRFAVSIIGGIGAARTSFILPTSSCVGSAVCSTQNIPIGNSNHFQVHGGAGVSIYLTDHVFVRPEFMLRYVPGLTDQYGSNVVPQGTVYLGYTFGDRE
jgi:hypothetical protein